MGRWAKASRSGGPRFGGQLPAPALTDFTVTGIAATTFNVNRVPAIPAPADRWGVLVVNKTTRAVAYTNVAVGTPIAATGLTTATQYEVRIAWFMSGALNRMSEWSDALTVTTL